MVEWVDRAGRPHLLFYVAEAEAVYRGRDTGMAEMWNVHAVTYGPSNISTGFATHSTSQGTSVQDALIRLMMSEF